MQHYLDEAKVDYTLGPVFVLVMLGALALFIVTGVLLGRVIPRDSKSLSNIVVFKAKKE